MKTTSTRHITRQILCWVLLIQIVNLSIDPPDRMVLKQAAHPVDHTSDEIESIYELISEELFDTAVPGNDENEQEKQLNAFDLYCPPSISSDIVITAYLIEHLAYNQDIFLAQAPECYSPPPEVM